MRRSGKRLWWKRCRVSRPSRANAPKGQRSGAGSKPSAQPAKLGLRTRLLSNTVINFATRSAVVVRRCRSLWRASDRGGTAHGRRPDCMHATGRTRARAVITDRRFADALSPRADRTRLDRQNHASARRACCGTGVRQPPTIAGCNRVSGRYVQLPGTVTLLPCRT